MASDSGIGVDFPVVTSLECLVAKEVNGLVVDTRKLLGGVGFSFDVTQAVCLVPAGRENIKRDLAAD